ncbi:MAG TPA: GIY-YIG nuclease family protein, partial [Candidatus Angelobacter sp.]|nr:GIY-YIG nuclease family protein [Candidatus Angelobacter sp.]
MSFGIADARHSLQTGGVLFSSPPTMRDGFQYKYWVYILSSRSGTLYVGLTGFFERRIYQHKYDTIEGFT